MVNQTNKQKKNFHREIQRETNNFHTIAIKFFFFSQREEKKKFLTVCDYVMRFFTIFSIFHFLGVDYTLPMSNGCYYEQMIDSGC